MEPKDSPAPKPVSETRPVEKMSGPWMIRLGAFSKEGGAQRMWSRLGKHPALAGARVSYGTASGLTTLSAGGFDSRSSASVACQRLKRDGEDCFVTR